MVQPRVVVVDIEGTTTPIAFVRDVLFPYARARLPGWIAEHGTQSPAAGLLAETLALAPGQPPLQTLLEWMDADAKVTPLKAIQGLIWQEGYERGDLHGQIYPDVVPHLRAWHQAGVRLCVYSSGSVAAQKLLFGYTQQGDLTPLFSQYFDTRIGPKREAASYAAIVAALGEPAGAILFLSDMAPELEAAAAAGLQVCQLVRPQDETQASEKFSTACDFNDVQKNFDLPGFHA